MGKVIKMPRGNQKQPINLIIAKGKKHLTKAEIEERQKTEIHTDHVNVKPPDYLNEEEVKEFYRISQILLDIGIITELDEDCLAHYLVSNSSYIKYTKKIRALEDELLEAKRTDRKAKLKSEIDTYLTYQDKALKQCRACANDLGLSISSRAKLVMPQPKEEKKENKFTKFKVVG